jgi:hypothetical protein
MECYFSAKRRCCREEGRVLWFGFSFLYPFFFFFNRTRRGKVFPFLLGLLNVEEENREQILQKNSERMEECQKKGMDPLYFK